MITEFINYLVNIKGYSQNTARAYEKDLRTFVAFIKEYDCVLKWSTITLKDVDAFVIHQTKRGLKPATTNRQLASVAAIYNYFRRNGWISESPVRFESRRKVEKRQPNTIPTDALKKAYDESKGTTHLMLGVLIETGIRVQELLDIRKCDVNTQTNEIRIKGKGQKQRTVAVTKETAQALEKMATYRRYDERVFKGYNQRETRQMIFQTLRPYTNAPQVSPHAIRHTFATEVARQGVNTTTLQIMLGHENIKTTQKYIDYAQQNASTAFRTYQNNVQV